MTREVVAVLPYRPDRRLDGPNARRHWAQRSTRSRRWRELAATYLGIAGLCQDSWRAITREQEPVVTFTVQQRRGPLMDDDNAASCLKAVRDGVAEWLGVTDAPTGPVQWRYAVERGPDQTTITLRWRE